MAVLRQSKSTESEFNVTQAIRAGLAAIPEARDSRNRDGTDKLRQWLADQYPDHTDRFEGGTFNATLSGERKKLAGGGVGAGATTRVSTSAKRSTTEPEPTLSDLKVARSWAEENGLKLEEAISLVESLNGLDLGTLKRALEGLREFGGK